MTVSNTRQHFLEQEYQQLKQRRDDLRVQLDLGKKEIRSSWNDLDQKWEGLEHKMNEVEREAPESEQVTTAARLLIDEIRDGFTRLRKAI